MAGYDSHWDKVVSLLHFDGEQGSTSFPDETGRSWVAEGFARIRTENKVFGSGSGRFDGTPSTRIRSPASPDFFLGTEDFCIEARVYISGDSALSTGGVRHAAIFTVASPPGASLEFFIMGNSTKTGTGLALWNGATLISVPGEIAHDEWNYFAVTRHGSVFRFWLNGSQLGSDQTSTIPFGSATLDAFIGGGVVTGYNYLLNGYIDELRITKGVARYTEDFDPPTERFPATDVPPPPGGEITGTVTVGGAAVQRQLIAISYAPQTFEGEETLRRIVVGETTSAEDGTYTLQTPGFFDEVIVLALDNYGEVWRPNRVYEVGQRIRPTTGNETGYGYDITIAGNSGETEPTWWIPAGGSDTGSIGTATARARPLWWSVAHAPIQPDAVEPEEPEP